MLELLQVGDDLGIDDLPLGSAGSSQENSGTDAALHCAARDRLSLRELEERYIDEVLGLTNGNKVQAAKILGIDRKTLYRRAERRKHDSRGQHLWNQRLEHARLRWFTFECVTTVSRSRDEFFTALLRPLAFPLTT